MKNLLLIIISLLLFSCKSREKQVQKSETQSEKKSEATYKIEDKTFEIVSGKEIQNFEKYKTETSSETKKDEIKNIEVIKEYYENGNIKSEINKSFSQLSEATKTAIAEMSEKLTKETEDKKYFENSSNHYYSLWQQEIAKSKTKDLQVKSEPKSFLNLWYILSALLFSLLFGWLVMPFIWRWFKNWLLRFIPYLKLIEWIKSFKSI